MAFGLIAGIRGPGKYNGVVIFDRWGACYLYSGAYLMPVSEKVKELLRSWEGKAVLVDAQEVYQPMNPGDGLITKLVVLGPAEEPGSVPMQRPPDIDGLSLTVAANFSKEAPDELVVQVRNVGSTPRQLRMDALAPTLLAKKGGTEQFAQPTDGPSFAALTRFNMLFLARSPARHTWAINGHSHATAMSVAPGTPISASVQIEPGEVVEVPLIFELDPGEYEFLAGYGGGVHAARSLASNRLDFDVAESGKARLGAGERTVNLGRKPRGRGSVCGRVTREDGTTIERAQVVLWPYPFPADQPSAASVGLSDASGMFRLDSVLEGKYVLAAAATDAQGRVLAGALGGRRAADAPPVVFQGGDEGCSRVLTLFRQPGYTLSGQTDTTAAGKTVRMILKRGDAFPWESSAVIGADGKYEFRNVPPGRYQFFAGWTGWGRDIEGDVEETVKISWPPRGQEVQMSISTCEGNSCKHRTPGEIEKDELLVISALRDLHRAEQAYAGQYKHGFTANLTALGPAPEWYRPTAERAGLVDAIKAGLTSGGDAIQFAANGYRVTYQPGVADENGAITKYFFDARPVTFGESGTRSFQMDEGGEIRATSENRAATTADPALENN
ncbi:MAG TPA: carboxypeptidase-like regulatory domain-containing protein [Bryobacteraceae bacterium]|nr:carboxypeptidase-like regulatory domain-containing protein [Bryobacteraceae bacterium]